MVVFIWYYSIRYSTSTMVQENMEYINKESQQNIYEINVQKNIMSKCAHKECLYETDNCMSMRKHLRARHIDDIIVIS